MALIVWCAVWVTLALLVAHEVRALGAVSTTAITAGTALEETGDALVSLAQAPFVGEDVGRLGERAREAGKSAQRSGRESRESVDELSVLLALAIGLVPTLPVAVLYLPARAARLRTIRWVSRSLREGATPELGELLARRAVHELPYHALARITTTPCRDLERGAHHELANAELARLGLPPRFAPVHEREGPA